MFDFKKNLEEILENIKADSTLTKSCANYFYLYSDIYVKPNAASSKAMGVDFNEMVKKLVPNQVKVFNEMIKPGGVMLFGCRKTGKTYLDALAVIMLGTRKPIKVHVLSSKKETASYVIDMIGLICRSYKLDIIEQEAVTHITFKNGTTVQAHSNTVADTGTYEADVVIIDEAQEVEKQVWSKIFPMLATGREMHIWITGTAKAGSRFHSFWFDDKLPFKKFILKKEDATWVSEETWKIVRSGMTERMYRQEVLMEWVEEEGAFFRAEDIDAAFKDYEKFHLKDYGQITSPVDWGWGHEHVMFVLGLKDGVIYELNSWGMQNAPRETIMEKFGEFYNKYDCYFILEGGQTAASWVGEELSSKHVDFEYSLFSKDKDYYWDAMEFVLDSKRIKLENPKLKQQLLRYNGDKKDDDYVDSLLHGVYYYVTKYMQSEYESWCYGGKA